MVRYTGADGDAADKLAEQLGGIDVQSDDEVTPGHLMVTARRRLRPEPGAAAGPERWLARRQRRPDPTNITAAGRALHRLILRPPAPCGGVSLTAALLGPVAAPAPPPPAR